MPNDTCPPTGQKLPEMPLPVKLTNSHDLEQVTDAQLASFADLIYGRTGIRVSPQKKMLLSNRLRRRLRETQIASFGDYYKHIVQLKPSDPEWDALVQEITTHETFLFRDESQWNWFRKSYLASCACRQAAGRNQGNPADLVGRVQHRRRGLTPSPARSPLRFPTGSSGRSACWAPTSAWAR